MENLQSQYVTTTVTNSTNNLINNLHNDSRIFLNDRNSTIQQLNNSNIDKDTNSNILLSYIKHNSINNPVNMNHDNNKNKEKIKFRRSHTCGSLYAKCNCKIITDRSSLNYEKAFKTNDIQNQSKIFISNDTIPQYNEINLNKLKKFDSIDNVINFEVNSKKENDISDKIQSDKKLKLKTIKRISNNNNNNNNNNNENEIDNQINNNAEINSTLIKQFNTTVQCDKLVSSKSDQSLIKQQKSGKNSFSNKQYQQSYSHPDTNFIFTERNRNPNKIKKSISNSNEILIKPGERIEIKHPKRSSSPNIGHNNFTILDIHPELFVKIHSNDSEKLTKKLVDFDKKKKNTSFDSDNSIEILSNDKNLLGNDIDDKIIIADDLQDKTNNKQLKQQDSIASNSSVPSISFDYVDPAHKFFLESGILGPVIKSNTVNLIRKTSKIMQDSNFVEQVRRNSKNFLSNTMPMETSPTNWTVNNDEKKDHQQNNSKSHSLTNLSGKNSTCNCETQIREFLIEIASLKDTLKTRDNDIYKLKREIHKLKSVLQQTTNGHVLTKPITINSDYKYSGLVGPTTNLINKQIAKQITSTTQTQVSINELLPTTSNDCNLTLSPPQQQHHHLAIKKQGVSGESCDSSNQQSHNIPIPKYDKDFRSKQLIKDAIMDNDFLKNIDSSQVRELVESMYNLNVAKGEYVIREGEAGAHLYVSAEGEFEVIKNEVTLGIMGPGKAFGELAILYNCTRTASIRVLCDSKVWVLDRRVFQQIMMRTGKQRIEDNVGFLKSVPLLKNLCDDILVKIADVLEVEFYPAGTYIIRQGASGDTFFLISQGTVKVTQKLGNHEKEIRTLERGDYFGEQALINEDKRTANIIAMAPGVECLTLDRQSFCHLIGDLCELKEKCYGDENRILAMKFAEKTKEVFGANLTPEYPDLKLENLEPVSTLGIGGFGRVELVKCYLDNHVKTFALKCLKKKHIIDTRQEEHVFSERTIMLSCNTPFICRLYRTFRDTKYVYMLLEACMGGEVWTILRDRGCFDEATTQFIIGCVLEAFEYLHSRGIIYRDLKPENLMLDERGYVKLVDFGFAKHIGGSQKTWTFCGTPEYVAPEIILNKGHDRAVDYWSLGILIHELLNGTPPFTANDPMKTYNIILKGIDMVDFPKHMPRSAITLIKKLCRDIPAERLGYQKGGIQDIKKHKWFQGFDWDGLSNLTLIPPFLRPVSHPLDTCYFDKFSAENDIPPDEFSGWDTDF